MRGPGQVARGVARLGVGAVAAGALLVGGAAPASAHGRGSDATNFSSTITADPGIDGVTWAVYNGDEFIGVENTTDTDLIVEGYEAEPYLRVGPDGVFANRNSEAYYLNATRYITTAAPEGVGPEAPPDWVEVSTRPSYAWQDHRIHWMSPTLPPQVTDAGVRTVVTSRWAIPFRYAGEEQEVTGELVWVPGTSPWIWLLAALPVVAVPGLLGLRTRPGDHAWPGLVRPAAAVLGVVAVLNITHFVDDLAATPVPLGSAALVAVQTALFIGIGLFGAVRAWQGGEAAFTALGVGTGALFVGQGLLYFPVLGASQAASVFPGAVTRAIVALTLAQALPLGAVAVIGSRRLLPKPGDRDRDADATAVVS